ncbi:MAG: putative zinc-binding protein [Desulfobacteraceae bacterium]
MNCADAKQSIQLTTTKAVCPVGEATGNKNINESKIPVLSCEGACIRGEIARLAAGIVSREERYGRGCHGELITVPDSAISRWIRTADKVVLIDGCFLRCHGRILENIIGKEKLVQFDALSHYNRYTDIFDYEDVPEAERKEVAQSVADWVIDSLENISQVCEVSSIPSQNQCGQRCG